jgi:hypothetical protein
MGKVAFKAKGTPFPAPGSAAKDGDINATGMWQKVGQETLKVSKKLFAENKPVLLSAKVTFKYVGGTKPGPGGAPVPISPPPNDVIILKPPGDMMGPGEKKLKTDTSKLVLIDGDKKMSPYGNVLEVSEVSGKLFTS